MDPIQASYVNQIKKVVEERELSIFKSAPSYVQVLEHVNESQGKEYLSCIRKNTHITDLLIREFATINDAIGKPNKAFFEGIGSISPTNLRQLWQAHLILEHFKSKELPIYNLVEVGGGQGGLCLAIHFLADSQGVPIQSQTIVDLPEILELQKLYLAEHTLSFPVDFVSAQTQGEDIETSDLCLISNQCFSEIAMAHQTKQIQHLFPKCIHGFFAWNEIAVQDFGKKAVEEPEVPKTGPKNRIVKF